MPKVTVDYDSLGNVQRAYDILATDELSDTYSELYAAQSTIEDIGSGHDNIWNTIVSNLQSKRRELQSSIEDVRDLSDMTGMVSDTFTETEEQIVNNIDEIADYFGFTDHNASNYTVTPNTGADTSSAAESEQPTPTPGSPSGTGTGATAGSSPTTTTIVSKSNDSQDDNTKSTQTTDDKKEKEESKEDNKEEKAKDDNTTDTTKEEQTDTSHDIEDSSTYEDSKENAEEVSQTSDSQNVSDVVTGVTGGAAIGTATEAASSLGNANNTTTDGKDEKPTDEKDPESDEEITGQAVGDILDDDFLINGEAETDSGTHQTSPIDVTLDKESGTNVIPALAGVAAAGLAGIGTKVALDKKDEEDDEEEEIEEETFNGDYDVAGEEKNQLLDSSDDIGFNPETIIEEDENNEHGGVENDIYPQSVLQDIQSKEESM